MQRAWQSLRLLTLGAFSFVLTTAGLNTAQAPDAQPATPSSDTNVTLAVACVPDDEKEDEIFFLSCGGLF